MSFIVTVILAVVISFLITRLTYNFLSKQSTAQVVIKLRLLKLLLIVVFCIHWVLVRIKPNSKYKTKITQSLSRYMFKIVTTALELVVKKVTAGRNE